MMVSLRAQLARVRDCLFPRRMCAKKKRYATAGYARSVLNYRQPHEAQRLFLYECPECRGWHITKMEQPTQEQTA